MTSLSNKVIKWWYSLTKEMQNELIRKYYPNQDYVHISSISSKLENMYYAEIENNGELSN